MAFPDFLGFPTALSRAAGPLPSRSLRRVSVLWWLALTMMLTATSLMPSQASASGYASQKLGFSVRFSDEVTSHRVLGVFVMPGQILSLEVVQGREGDFLVSDSTSRSRITGRARWTWNAPDTPGLYPLQITRLDTQEVMTLNVFVLTPRENQRHEYINGYRMGLYPRMPYRGLDAYLPPNGFVMVTEANQDTPVSPHFTLSQFVSKQVSSFPKYLILRERLLLLLEGILESVNEAGIPAETLQIMSGFRTPWYNASIGNGRYSRHLWGGAADLYIDEQEPHGRMDDLNGDGLSDLQDARILGEIVEAAQRRQAPTRYLGGLGLYGPKPHRGPFVHVDVRGFEARWEFD